MLETFFDKFASYQAKRSLPKYHGRVEVRGLDGPVSIRFDRYKVPHIEAGSSADAMFAQGYVHAMERMWQMEFTRRVSGGRLAETFGNQPTNWRDLSVHLRDTRLVDVDYFLRNLRLMWAAERTFAAFSDETQYLVQAYCDGVNAWLMPRAHRRLPVEYRLLGLDAVPWTPVDAVAVGKAMAYHLNFAWKTILVQAALAQKLPAHLAEQLVPEGYPPEGPYTVAGAAELLSLDVAVRDTLGFRGTGLGSDGWVLGGSRTESGYPLVANDPHLRLRTPCVWYLNHMRGGDFDVQGASLPGMPGMIVGRTPRTAWSVTAAMLHDSDIYVEQLNENLPDTYLVGQDWQPLQVIREDIKVKDGYPVNRTVRVSRHGPLLSDALPHHRRDAHHGLALRWVAHEPSQEVAGVLAVNRCRDAVELRRVLHHFGCPAQNFMYADVDGNIGYTLAGLIPIRKAGKGQRPVPGWNDDHEWLGYVPFEDNPHVENPPCGFVASANNQIADDSYPHFLSYLWEPPYRIRRIHQLIGATARHTVESTRLMQTDLVSLQATDFLDGVIRPFASSEAASALSPGARRLLDLVVDWDGACDTDSWAAAAFHVIQYQLMLQIFGERMGEDTLMAYLEHFNESLVKLDKILSVTESDWFGPEGRNGAVSSAIEAAVRWLKRELGPKVEEWQWGKLHQAVAEHPMGSETFTNRFFNVGPYETPGSIGTLNAGQFFYAFPFRHYVGASVRQIVDLSPADDSHYVLHTGQSGNPLSPHYRDQAELWLNGELIPMRPADDGSLLELVPEAPSPAAADRPG